MTSYIHLVKIDDVEKERRVEICNKCEHLSKLKVCKKCGCPIQTKTWLKKAKCPIGKW